MFYSYSKYILLSFVVTSLRTQHVKEIFARLYGIDKCSKNWRTVKSNDSFKENYAYLNAKKIMLHLFGFFVV